MGLNKTCIQSADLPGTKGFVKIKPERREERSKENTLNKRNLHGLRLHKARWGGGVVNAFGDRPL